MVVGWRSQEIDAQKSEDSRRCEIFLLGLDFFLGCAICGIIIGFLLKLGDFSQICWIPPYILLNEYKYLIC